MDSNINTTERKKGCLVEISSKHTNYSKQGSGKNKETNTATALVNIKKKQSDNT